MKNAVLAAAAAIFSFYSPAQTCHAFVSATTVYHPIPTTIRTILTPIRTSLHLSAEPNNNSQRGPLERISDVFEEAAASTIDYLLMQPKRDVPPGLRRVRTQFIAALGDPKASSGRGGAEKWGIWRIDPGPRGVFLKSI